MAAAVADVRERGSEVMAISDDHEFLAAADTAFPLVPGVTPFAAWSDYAYYAFAPDGGFDHAPCERIRSHRTHSSDSRSTFPGACPQFRQGRHTGFPRWGDLASGSGTS